MSGTTVNSVCVEALARGFPLVGRFHEPLEYTSASEYLHQCEQIFEDARDFQHRNYRLEPKLLTLVQFRQVARFAEKRGLKVRIIGYRGAHSATFSLWGNTIGISPRAPYLSSYSVTRSLEHEYGHVRDGRLFVTRAPELKKLIVEGKWDESHGRKYISTVLEFMREGLAVTNRLEFDRLRRRVVGNLDHCSGRRLKLLAMFFAELFRKGEEILDQRFEEATLHDDYTQLKKGHAKRHYRRVSILNGRGERVDLRRLLFVAALQEARLWERFRQRPDYNPDSLEYIKPHHLKFVRLCIRGASRYFINTAAR